MPKENLGLSSGIFDRTRLVSNVLMLILVAGNIFFSIQYTQNVKEQMNKVTDVNSTRFLAIHALNDVINMYIATKGVVTYDDRVKLENDILQVKDPALTAQWQGLLDSAKDPKADHQSFIVNIMSILAKDSI